MDIPTVIVQGVSIPVEVAITKEQIDKGLSGRLSLNANAGMLFVFDHAAILQFWMPDMHFPLDMIWIGTDMKVVDITRNAVPMRKVSKLSFWKKSEPVWYRPSLQAQYVLEVNADFAKHHGIEVGNEVQFVSI